MTKREKIFHAGAKLFAERSYSSVGIRDIAREAGVNSAMISYYYGSKRGLLREIFSRFKDIILAVISKSMADSSDHYELCEFNVDRMLNAARENRDIFHVGLRELNHDSPELKDLREDLNNAGWKCFSEFLVKTGGKASDSNDVRDITFTGVMGVVFSDYLLGGGAYIDNDEKVKVYKEVISNILKYGTPALWK